MAVDSTKFRAGPCGVFYGGSVTDVGGTGDPCEFTFEFDELDRGIL